MSFTRPDIFRPPSEWKSYFLPLTRGCSNNTCTFCTFYSSRLQVRDLVDVKKEIDAVSLYMKKRICMPGVPEIVYETSRQWDGKRVFLQDGDALVYPFSKLQETLEYLNEKLPFIERIGTYATAQDILRITPSKLVDLGKLKLGIVYIGLESGNDDILQAIAKGVDSLGMIEAVKKAKDADISTSVTVILGIGGIDGSKRHAFDTAVVLGRMDPDYVGALTLTLVPGTPIYQQWKLGNFSPITAFQSLEELMAIIKNSDFTNCFLSSMHASNYFAVRGALPKDKDRMIDELKHIIEEGDQDSLRPEFLRGL